MYEQAFESLSHLADALACAAVGTDLPPDGLAGCQRLLWVAVQLRIEPSPFDRLKYLADALELVSDGFSHVCAQGRHENGATLFRGNCFEHAIGTGSIVSGLLRGIFAQAERDSAEIAKIENGGAR